jgi:phage shock protein C
MLGGVCAGIAEYLDTDPTLIRLLWVIVTVLTGFAPGIVAYIICWIIVPEK